MRQTSGKFAESAHLVTLLFRSAVLANPIGHHADQARQQLGNPLQHLIKAIFGKAQGPGWLRCADGHRETRQAGEREHTDNLSGPPYKAWSVAASVMSPSADFTLKQNEQGIRGGVFPHGYVSG